jgi:hypothetical protein
VEGRHADGALGVGSVGGRDRNPGTCQRRVEVSISKMQSGKRRPCCFNVAAGTDPDPSKNGKLIDPR